MHRLEHDHRFDEVYFLLRAFEPFHQTAFTLRVSETILGPSRLGLSETAAAPARLRYHARRVGEESRTRVPLPLCESFSFGAPPHIFPNDRRVGFRKLKDPSPTPLTPLLFLLCLGVWGRATGQLVNKSQWGSQCVKRCARKVSATGKRFGHLRSIPTHSDAASGKPWLELGPLVT